MMHSKISFRFIKILITSVVILTLASAFSPSIWGFFGHRRINRMAVFTIPAQLIPLYKKNIEYITEHAVDPDKRRYATKHEAVRHYIDIDHWGKLPFDNVPQYFTDALIQFGSLWQVSENGVDSLLLYSGLEIDFTKDRIVSDQLDISYSEFKVFFDEVLMEDYYEDKMEANAEQLNIYCQGAVNPERGIIVFEDAFSEYGILPYHLVKMQEDLTDAFFQLDMNKIMRLSADIGHYIADAHVPLHTTENYNGELTNQDGIHAFWESRLPELFADEQYDFLVGRAEYIEDPRSYYWNVIYDTHSLLDSVLIIEKELSQSFPSDLQYCYEDRLEYTIRTQCEEYSGAYHTRLDGMVEEQMQKSIRSVGSAWYTAWVDAGQPDLKTLMNPIQLTDEEERELRRQEQLFEEGEIKGRKHDN